MGGPHSLVQSRGILVGGPFSLLAPSERKKKKKSPFSFGCSINFFFLRKDEKWEREWSGTVLYLQWEGGRLAKKGLPFFSPPHLAVAGERPSHALLSLPNKLCTRSLVFKKRNNTKRYLVLISTERKKRIFLNFTFSTST